MKLKQKQTRCQFTWVNMIKLLFRRMILKFLLGSEKNREGAFFKGREKKNLQKKKKNTLQPSLQSVTDDKVLPLPFPNMYTVSTQAFLSLFNFSRRNEMSNEQEIPPNMTMTELLNTGL